MPYSADMPKLWTRTIETHRRDVRHAILDTAAKLIAERGPSAVTMSQLAADTGVGRATLYKYFPDIEAVLRAWHERQVEQHLEQLETVRDRPGSAGRRLEAVLEAFALICHERHGSEIAALIHQGEHMARAHQHLAALVRDLLTEGAAAGELRSDVAPEELATYCIHALTAASALPSKAAAHRLVGVTMQALRATR
jgi:AcrR family transcriptional regulator